MQVTIGIDPHKGSHTAVAIDTSEASLAEVRVSATPSQTEELLCWAARLDQRRWAIESAQGLGYLLSLNELHAAAFATRVYSEDEWNWVDLTTRYGLGWVVARDAELLVGFVNVIWDGLAHAWIQDTMVDPREHRRGIGTQLVAEAVTSARAAGCEWLHVDFDDDLRGFYFDVCGFTPTNAGLIALR